MSAFQPLSGHGRRRTRPDRQRRDLGVNALIGETRPSGGSFEFLVRAAQWRVGTVGISRSFFSYARLRTQQPSCCAEPFPAFSNIPI
jgi:hypothetical protein